VPTGHSAARQAPLNLTVPSRERPADAPSAVDPVAAFAGRRAVVEIVGRPDEPWRVDLIAAVTAQRPWQSGPLVSEARVGVKLPPAAVGGATSMRLVADLSVRADGTLWADVWFRNDIAMQPGGGGARYAARVVLDGREALRTANLVQPHYTGWGRLLGVGRGGTPFLGTPLVRPDATYLAEAGAVARYDLSVGVAEPLLARLRAAVAAPAWAVPLGSREVTQSMGTTGGRPDIGPATQAQAAWLISGDPRAAAYAIGQAETAGSIPWHFWDEAGGQATLLHGYAKYL